MSNKSISLSKQLSPRNVKFSKSNLDSEIIKLENKYLIKIIQKEIVIKGDRKSISQTIKKDQYTKVNKEQTIET